MTCGVPSSARRLFRPRSALERRPERRRFSVDSRAGFASAASPGRGMPGLPVELEQRQETGSLNASYNSGHPCGQTSRTPAAQAKVARNRCFSLKQVRGKSCGCETYAKNWQANDLMRGTRALTALVTHSVILWTNK